MVLNETQEALCDQRAWDFSDLGALFVSCTLKRSPEVSNTEALRRISSAQAFLVDVRRAADVIPDLAKEELLHAGPPLQDWREACGALHGAVTGTLVHLGLAGDLASAEEARADESEPE